MPPDDTNITIIGFSFAVLMGFLTLVLPRRWATLPLIVTGSYMTLGQMVNIVGLHFTILRIMILFGWLRLILRHELSSVKLNGIDKAFILWVFFSFTMYSLRLQTSEGVIYRLGVAYTAVGAYFLFRFLIRDVDDIAKAIKATAFIMVPLAVAMLLEKSTGRNLFSIFGGVPEITVVREGSLRCQGPFRHPILAGTFGVTSIPLFIALWVKARRYHLAVVMGMISAVLVMLFSASSGPVLSLLCVIAGFLMWPFRKRMSVVWWGTLLVVISLHVVMKAPVWYLIAKISYLIGGTGWHRSELIDQAIRHFGEWWFWGTSYTAHWMPYRLVINPDMVDITSQYILEGVTGGFITMLMFIILIFMCFRGLGRSLRAMGTEDPSVRLILWSMGVALFTHAISFLSVAYFDQSVLFWYLLLAIIARLTDLSKLKVFQAETDSIA